MSINAEMQTPGTDFSYLSVAFGVALGACFLMSCYLFLSVTEYNSGRPG